MQLLGQGRHEFGEEAKLSGQPILKRAANALFADVTLSKAAKSYSTWGTWGILNSVISSSAARNGGLWVGGDVSLYQDRLAFQPNGLNVALQDGDMTADIPLSNVSVVKFRPAFITGIVELELTTNGASHFSFRCSDAKGVSQMIISTIRSLSDANRKAEESQPR